MSTRCIALFLTVAASPLVGDERPGATGGLPASDRHGQTSSPWHAARGDRPTRGSDATPPPARGNPTILAFDTGDNWQNYILREELNDRYTVTVVEPEQIPNIDFEQFDVIYVTDKPTHKRWKGTPLYAVKLAERASDIRVYLENGGRIAVGVQAYGGSSEANGDEYAFLPEEWVRGQPDRERVFGDDVEVLDWTHPLFRPFCDDENLSLENWGSSYHGELPTGSLPVLAEIFDSDRALIRAGSVFDGAGLVVVWTLDPDWHATPSAIALVRSALNWLTRKGPENVSAKCKNKRGKNMVRATAKNGLEGTPAVFLLDGQDPQAKVFNPGGRAKAKWRDAEPGSRTVEVKLACGVRIRDDVQCPQKPCTGKETLSAKCRDREGINVLQATVREGVTGEEVLFLLDGLLPQLKTFNDRGKASAEWSDVSPGRHKATADLACKRLRQKTLCP